MLAEIESFANWQRRRNPTARTWRDCGYDLAQFVAVVGDRPPAAESNTTYLLRPLHRLFVVRNSSSCRLAVLRR